MKKVIAMFAICLMVIPMLSATVATDEVVKPYSWVEYGEYELSGRDTARLVLVTIYEDISPYYKGWYANFSEEWQRTEILTEISTAIEIVDSGFNGWQITARDIIVNIQDDMDNWILNLDGKDYTEWLDYALTALENPDDIFHSEIVPFGCNWLPGACFSHFR